MKLNDFIVDADKSQTEFPYASLAEEFALLRAMAAHVKEIEVTPEQFVTCMRYAINAQVYQHVRGIDKEGYEYEYPTILGMRVTVI